MRQLLCAGTVALAAVVGVLASARADDVVTKVDGGKLRGKVISENADEVKIKTAGGVIVLPRSEVATVDREKDVSRQLADRQLALEKKPDAKGWYELSRWCLEKELVVASAECLKRTVALDPDHADARAELGYRKHGGRWVTNAEYFRSVGFVQHEGRWITQGDKEKYDQGLVPWGDDWITKADADRRQEEIDRAEREARRGVPGGNAEAPATAKPEKVAKAPRGGKPAKDRYFEGKLLYTKTQDQIAKALAAIDLEKVVCPAPTRKPPQFEPLDAATQIAAIKRLKQYRYLCDVSPEIEINGDWAETCSAACRLLDLVGHLDHKPAKPAGCSDALYRAGLEGTSHSNLHQNGDAVRGVDGFMFDSDPSNVDVLGHRRWCLNVSMRATAFGVFKQFVAMWSMDQTRPVPPYDAVLYPARGYFPLTHIQEGAAWSAHLSHRFGKVTESELKITVSPIDLNMARGTPVEIERKHVDDGGYGTGGSCLSFTPKVTLQAGARYWVEIRGLREPAGAEALLEYLVELY